MFATYSLHSKHHFAVSASSHRKAIYQLENVNCSLESFVKKKFHRKYLLTIHARAITAVIIFFHFVTCQLFFDVWRYVYEVGGYKQARLLLECG